jgi:hypothetical protein
MSSRASPAVAASLSFLLPGLGQLSIGAVRRGVLLAVPAVGLRTPPCEALPQRSPLRAPRRR